MSKPANSGGRRTWLIVTFSCLSLLFFYLISFGPMLYLAGKTEAEYQTWFQYSIGPLYTPHLWGMTRSESYFAYGWWWYALARPGAEKPDWEEWRRDH